MDFLKILLKQPFSIVAVLLGAALIALPYIQIDKENHLATHARTGSAPIAVGTALMILGAVAAYLAWWTNHVKTTKEAIVGLDLNKVKEEDGELSTCVGDCEIRVVEGLLQDFASEPGTVVVLPCNEYFDDECANDPRSALGAYASRVFDGRVVEFLTLMKEECRKNLGNTTLLQKTETQRAESYGPGRCLLLLKPLRHSTPIALVSTTTQRAGQGLSAEISFLFTAMRELVTKLADERLNEIVMPILGAGHGHIGRPMALVGLLLALAEAARYGQGSQRLRKATVVVFKRDKETPAQIDRMLVRRALALVASND